jgi:hypothetical protein
MSCRILVLRMRRALTLLAGACRVSITFWTYQVNYEVKQSVHYSYVCFMYGKLECLCVFVCPSKNLTL